MSERRGLIIERSRNRVTAVTKSGEFVTWKDRRDLMPGEQVTIPSPRLQGFVWRKLVPAVGLAMMLVFMSFFGYQQYLYARPLMAYVTFDSAGGTAGSIELEVNDRGLVKSATGLNQAGTEALAKVNCEMKPVQAVLASLSKTQTDTKDVVVAFIPVEAKSETSAHTTGGKNHKKDNRAADLEKKVLDTIKEATTLVLDLETRNEAKELGISAGRAASWALWKHESEGKPGKGGPDTSDAPDAPDDASGTHGFDKPHENPGQGQVVEPGKPGQSGQQEQPGQKGQSGVKPGNSTPPGQGKKGSAETLLDEIRSTLPQFDFEELDKKDSNNIEKRLDEVTKEWLKTVKEMTKKTSENVKDSESGDGQKPGGPNASGSGEKGPSQSGKSQDKPGKDEPQPDKSQPQGEGQTKPGRKDTQSGSEKTSPAKDDSGKAQDGSSKDQKGQSRKGSTKGTSSMTRKFQWTSEFLKNLWK